MSEGGKAEGSTKTTALPLLLNSSINRSFKRWYSSGLYYIPLEPKLQITFFKSKKGKV